MIRAGAAAVLAEAPGAVPALRGCAFRSDVIVDGPMHLVAVLVQIEMGRRVAGGVILFPGIGTATERNASSGRKGRR